MPANPSIWSTDILVAVLNKGLDKFELMYAGEVYEFPPGEAVRVTPDAAWHMFSFETRPSRLPPNSKGHRDLKGGGDEREASHHKLRLISNGWANDKEAQAAYLAFEFKVIQNRRHMSAKEFAEAR
jgi:hypothetical protein